MDISPIETRLKERIEEYFEFRKGRDFRQREVDLLREAVHTIKKLREQVKEGPQK